MGPGKYRPCSSCDSNSNRIRGELRCYDDRKLLHIAVDLSMGAPVEMTLKGERNIQHNGYFLQYNQQSRSIHFQPFGDPEVLEFYLDEICTLRYSS